MSDKKQWRFEPLDSWFFREARAFDTSGSNELSSLFPPPARTVAGAVRTLIGETQGVDWERFAQGNQYADLKNWIGVGDDLGQLKMSGPYPLWNGERLYPVPLHLLAKEKEFVFLTPGAPVKCDLDTVQLPAKGSDDATNAILPVKCDLGTVQLPALEKSLPGAKPLENAWLDSKNLQRVLSNQSPEKVYHAKDLYANEPRLGIARNNAQRTAAEGLLYQTRHVRPRPELAIGTTVSGIPRELHPASGVIRFGGEGRAGAVKIGNTPPFLPMPTHNSPNLLLMLLTHADFGGNWLFPDFKRDANGDIKVWRGQLNGIDLILHSAVLGKAAREGGWDLLNKKPRPVKSLIPAGSVYFCTVNGDPQVAITALHGWHVGHDTAIGRGELAVGFWKP